MEVNLLKISSLEEQNLGLQGDNLLEAGIARDVIHCHHPSARNLTLHIHPSLGTSLTIWLESSSCLCQLLTIMLTIKKRAHRTLHRLPADAPSQSRTRDLPNTTTALQIQGSSLPKVLGGKSPGNREVLIHNQGLGGFLAMQYDVLTSHNSCSSVSAAHQQTRAQRPSCQILYPSLGRTSGG